MATLCRFYPLLGSPRDIRINVMDNRAIRETLGMEGCEGIDSKCVYEWWDSFASGEAYINMFVLYESPTDLPNNPHSRFFPGNCLVYLSARHDTSDGDYESEGHTIYPDYREVLTSNEVDHFMALYPENRGGYQAIAVSVPRDSLTHIYQRAADAPHDEY